MLLSLPLQVLAIWCLFAVLATAGKKSTDIQASGSDNTALVTLVTGSNSGYEYGAVALGESLKMVGSKLRRIVLVTPDVTEHGRTLLELAWEVREVEPISCNQQFHPSVSSHSSTGDGMKSDLARWDSACTKFQIWRMVEFERLIFMDSDTIVTAPIDDAMWGYSNASLAAAPEVFPPDTFNSGFLVITPSIATHRHLLRMNKKFGSLEGGDQGVLVNYLCPSWYSAAPDDPHCGRIPWFFNVEAQYFLLYKTYRTGYGLSAMRMIHYINDGKPWKTLMFDMNPGQYGTQRPSMIQQLSEDGYVESHMYWRYCFLRATGQERPTSSIYYKQWSDVTARKGAFARISLPLYDEDPNNRHMGTHRPGPEDPKFLPGAAPFFESETVNEKTKDKSKANIKKVKRKSGKTDGKRGNKKNKSKKTKRSKHSEL